MQALAQSRPVLVRSFNEWRCSARALLARQVAPDAVQWLYHAGAGEPASPALPSCNSTLRISRKLMAMLRLAACCRVPNRWAFLYLVLWRWQHGERQLLSCGDADGQRLLAMVLAVRRDERDMHARIRFRERREDAGPPRLVAWCEPGHDVLPLLARHFAARLAGVTWMIATPEASVAWDGAALHYTGPLLEPSLDADASYYRAVYTPARLHADLVGTPQRAALNACRRCGLWQHATQAVPGAGPQHAAIMLLGEQPGDQEDLAGQPFVGPAGKVLERALVQAGLERRAVYLTNAVKHFKWEPRGKRRMHKTPAQREVAACSHWLDQELAQVRPRVVVALGSTALKAVTGNPHATLKDVMDKPFQHQGRWIVAVYHPSYVLRVPGAEARAQAFAQLAAGLRAARQLAL
ncbi:MAG: UdgX family uracil-DNA binding protein [Pseudomonadota bacterium]